VFVDGISGKLPGESDERCALEVWHRAERDSEALQRALVGLLHNEIASKPIRSLDDDRPQAIADDAASVRPC
jgi:hypothetical protein